MDNLKRAYWYLVAMTLVLFLWVSVIFIVGWISNKQRIDDIQRSRTYSCERTYQAFKEVLSPFFPPVKTETARERARVNKFNRIIQEKIASCDKQTST